jgi:cytochrome oxidase Cu insertion factor (SCO1/SenC/PrrC family)
VVCTDVLEHIELDRLRAVMNHIQGLARKVILLSVALDPANKTLSDGRNAHLIQKPPAWWEARIDEHGMDILDLPDMPTPYVAKPEKRQKRWIAVVTP